MILDKIVEWKKHEIAERKKAAPIGSFERRARTASPRPFEQSLMHEGRLSILAEIKRASPSAGAIRADADPAGLAAAMESAGADALSVLTDTKFFAGSLDDMAAARAAVALPVLEKDFVIDEYQVFEAAACGADAVLLIVRILPDDALLGLRSLAGELGLGCLVEVHTREDLHRALSAQPTLLGINNRDLATFRVDIATTLDLLPEVPEGVGVVSQSGISTPEEARQLFQAGACAIQVGESLMRAPDPAAKVRELLSLEC